jgi:hypothetical protein
VSLLLLLLLLLLLTWRLQGTAAFWRCLQTPE